MVVRNFFTVYLLPNQTLGHFGLGRPLALREIPGLGRKRRNAIYGARGTFGETIPPPQIFSPNVRNFLTFYVLADRTPMGGKSRNTGFLGHFGLGRPLALRQIPGLDRKRKNAISRSYGLFWGGNPDVPKFSPRRCATFLPFTFWPTGPPRAGNREIRGS